MRFKYSSVIFFSIFAFLSGCSPIFVMQAAYKQGQILYRRESIQDIIDRQSQLDLAQLTLGESKDNNEYSKELIAKLELVMLAREFCIKIGLDPKETFTSYSYLGKDEVPWIVSASKLDQFEFYQWWFPIIGTVPYKGFFSKESALEQANELQLKDYETWVRSTAAFSTLGWFNDPLLTPTLDLEPVDLVNTIIHESVHTNFWIPGSVALNESLASFIGARASIEFFSNLKPEQLPTFDVSTLAEKARIKFNDEIKYSITLESLWQRLNILYSSDLSKQDKLIQRLVVFEQEKNDFKLANPDLAYLSQLNNAELMQRRLYLRNIQDFENLFLVYDQDWPRFLEYAKNFSSNTAEAGEDQNFKAFFSPLT
jgi:predicted aminopeptidase